MIVGHGFLAFSLAAILAYLLGIEKEKCLILGVFAGFFGVIPDVDIIFAWKEILVIFSSGLSGFVEGFWTASRTFHRGISHSLVTLVLATAGFSIYFRFRNFLVGPALLVILTSYGFLLGGFMSGLVISVFILAGLLVTAKSRDYLDQKSFLLASATGLLTHPFGDIFTGTPPDFLFPLGFNILESRFILYPDPVINLLLIFFLELFLVAAGLSLVLKFRGDPPELHPEVLLGLLYFPAQYILIDPTLSVSYHFVFSIIAFGTVITGSSYFLYRQELEKPQIALNLCLTVFLAGLAYIAVYLI